MSSGILTLYNYTQVEVLNLYCDPKDSKSQQSLETKKDDVEETDENVKLYTIPDKEYSRPYTGKFVSDFCESIILYRGERVIIKTS